MLLWTRTDGWVGDESYAEMAVLVGHRPIFTLIQRPCGKAVGFVHPPTT